MARWIAVSVPRLSEEFHRVARHDLGRLVARALGVRQRYMLQCAVGNSRGMTDAACVVGGSMKLFYSPGACSLAVHIVLREAERSFDLERVDLKAHRTASGADYLQINPKGYVPALRLDGPGSPILTEASAVLQYIADLVAEKGLAPAYGTMGRYQLEEWLSFIATEIHKAFGPLFAPDTPVPTQERARAKIGKRFGYTNDMLGGRAFLMGETFTVADAYLYAMVRWCERFDIDLPMWPNLDAFFHRVTNRSSVQAALYAEGLLEHKRARRSA
jgi:glutathione S-transferase